MDELDGFEDSPDYEAGARTVNEIKEIRFAAPPWEIGGEQGRAGREMAQVTVRDLRKSFGSVEVIHGVDVDIEDGQFVVLVGPSGCGKSTLLRMIAGLEAVTAGTIQIGVRIVNNLPPAERDIAMVFQNYALYPHKTVAANMGFALKQRDRKSVV